MTKQEAKKALSTFPTHEEIEKYGYSMYYCKHSNRWFASYVTCKDRTIWFVWTGESFEDWERGEGDFIRYEKLAEIAFKTKDMTVTELGELIDEYSNNKYNIANNLISCPNILKEVEQETKELEQKIKLIAPNIKFD